MELSINHNVVEPKFRFEPTTHKLGMRIWGDRRSFHELHEVLGECWDCENADMARAEGCSYIGVISYFSYEVRHAFMGDRLVMSYGKPVKELTDELFNSLRKNRNILRLVWDYHGLTYSSSWLRGGNA